jgi:hypothetical protein
MLGGAELYRLVCFCSKKEENTGDKDQEIRKI